MNCEDNTDSSRIAHIFVFLRFTLFKILKSFPHLSKVTEEVAAYFYIIVTSCSFTFGKLQ